MIEHTKYCIKCGQEKPLKDFIHDKSRPDGFHPYCKSCRKEWYYKDGHGRKLAYARYLQNPERAREQQRHFRKENPEKIKAYHKQYYETYHTNCLARSANTRQKITEEAFNAYGGFICNCCGETIPKFLTIDHINGVTKEERKRQRTGWLFYRWLKLQGYPPGYQVLCYNCNLGRARNQGICPHKE